MRSGPVMGTMALLALVLASSVAGAEGMDPQFLGSLSGGRPHAMAVSGNYAYCAAGAAVLVLDISAPQSPRLAGSTYLEGIYGALDIVISGTTAYVAANGGGLWILDISDPLHPTPLSHVHTPDRELAVALEGSYAYVADNTAGLQVVDVSDPGGPTVVGSCDTPGWAYDVEVKDGYAYVADYESGLRVIDVRTPSAPAEVAFYDTSGIATGVAISGSHLYLADDLDFLVFDIGNPASPVLAGTGQFTPAGQCVVSGQYAYLPCSYGGMAVVDVSSPTTLAQVGWVDTPPGPCGAAAAGDYVLLANPVEGVHVIDVSDPSAPSQLALYRTFGIAGSVALSGGCAYLGGADGKFVWAVDVTDPALPVPLVALGQWGRSPVRVCADGEYLYSLSTSTEGSGLIVYDIADPAAPLELGITDMSPASDLALDGSYAYVAGTTSGLQVMDISDRVHPAAVGQWHPGGETIVAVAVEGEYAYLADMYYGLRVVSAANPTSPREAGQWPASSLVTWDVAVHGDYAYLAEGDDGLVVLDVSDPARPAFVGAVEGMGSVQSVEVLGSYAYVTGSYGLHLIGLCDVDNLAEAGRWSASPAGEAWAPGGGTDVAVDGNTVYLAAASWGLMIFALQPSFADVPADYWASDGVERCAAAAIVTGYEDGTYQPTESVTRAQMAVFISRAAAGGDSSISAPAGDPTFADVSAQHWAYRYIEYAVGAGIVEGYADGYHPDETVDRGQMAVFVARAKGWVSAGDDLDAAPELFTDVPAGYWAGAAIAACGAHRVVSGYADGSYRPAAPVTRDQMSVFIARAFDLGE